MRIEIKYTLVEQRHCYATLSFHVSNQKEYIWEILTILTFYEKNQVVAMNKSDRCSCFVHSLYGKDWADVDRNVDEFIEKLKKKLYEFKDRICTEPKPPVNIYIEI